MDQLSLIPNPCFQYNTAELVANSKENTLSKSFSSAPPLSPASDGNSSVAQQQQQQHPTAKPYIAAKFLQRSIPYTFVLGNSQNYEGFINKKLSRGVLYKIFVRAYVDTPQKHLYTSSPFSPELSLDMMAEPPGTEQY